MTTVQALKDLYVALGGELADVQDMSTNVAVLNAISAKYSGASDAVLNPEAVANIAAVAGDIGEGGESDFSTAEVTIVNNLANADVFVNMPIIFTEDDYNASAGQDNVGADSTKNNMVILYKGKAIATFSSSEYAVAIQGDIEKVDLFSYEITGNGTFTITNLPT